MRTWHFLRPLSRSVAVISLAHLKNRLGQYAALWVGGFLLTGLAVLAGLTLRTSSSPWTRCYR